MITKMQTKLSILVTGMLTLNILTGRHRCQAISHKQEYLQEKIAVNCNEWCITVYTIHITRLGTQAQCSNRQKSTCNDLINKHSLFIRRHFKFF